MIKMEYRVVATSLLLLLFMAPLHAQNSFGESAPQGGFGQPQQQPGGFGQQQGGFGQPQQQPGGFGQQQGGFGQSQQQPGGFGQQQGGFGQSQQQPGGFGQQPGGVGQSQQQPGGLGQQPQQPGGLGRQQPQQPGGMNPQFLQMLDQMAQYERKDFGIQAPRQLHSGAMHGSTPASIPGGQIITTKELFELIQSQRTRYVIFDVLGGPQMLPGATPMVQAAQPGQLGDQISQQMQRALQQGLQGNKEVALIFYCQSVQCWMSYNAALRAIHLGYTNVRWYRGGIEAWQHAGGPLVQSQRGY